MSITVQNVTKRFGNYVALDNINLEVPDGKLVALLGPSGSGKTTLLRIIAGLETAEEGTVLFHDQDVTQRSARDRNVGFVFQHYALFRHMNVFENVAFALRVRRRPEDQIEERVEKLLKLIRLEGFGQRYPGQLSGGQRQRVALARALCAEPQLLLLDEPFGALDAKVRQELRQWLRRLHDEIRLTSVFVTHDQEEAFAVSDQVVILNKGKIEQVGSPQEVFEHPANAFVMDFLGNVEIASTDYPHAESQQAALYVRPHELEIERTNGDPSSLQAKVEYLNPAGPVTRVELRALDYGVTVQVELSHTRQEELRLRIGDLVYVSPRRVRVFMQSQPLDYSI